MKNSPALIQKLKAALQEDIGSGDVTSELLVPKTAKGKAVIVAKEPGIFFGGDAAKLLFQISDPTVSVKSKVRDGVNFTKGQTLIECKGSVRSILKTERTMLNLLQHLCGVATQTRAFVHAVKGRGVKILDTRKTTPLWRELEKAAVKAGGGCNHRMGLYDAVFVKENHRRFGDLRKLMTFKGASHLRSQAPGIEIEVRNVRELMEALMIRPKVILFDNFPVKDLKEAVKIARAANPKVILEASGGITLENVQAYAQTGVDQISVGSLTHSVKAVDLSLMIK